MARVLTDIVRPEVRRNARRARAVRRFETPGPCDAHDTEGHRTDGRPTSVTVFFDGGSARSTRLATALRRAFPRGRSDILWRDLRRHPQALSVWHVGTGDWRGRLFVVDRQAVLRAGLDARIALWREMPGGRDCLARFVAAFLALPLIHGIADAILRHGRDGHVH